MKGIVKFLIGFVTGAVVSYMAVQSTIKAQCEKECQKEIDEYKKFVKEKVLNGGTVESHQKAVEKLQKMEEKYGDISDDEPNEEVKKVERPAKKNIQRPTKKTEELDVLKMYDVDDDTIPVEITYAEREILVDDQGYDEISLRYDIVNDELTSTAGDYITNWSEIDKGLVLAHDVGDNVYIANVALETVFDIRIAGDVSYV